MVSVDKIADKFVKLDEFLEILREIARTPIDAFLKDKILIGSAKYYLQISIECCLDVANHIIAAERLRAPTDYADSFRVLEENGIVGADLINQLQQMAKFRNRLVHLYGDIDNAYVSDIINHDLKDMTDYKTIIMRRYCK